MEDHCKRFSSSERREAYLSGEPPNDERFISVFAHELEHAGGYSKEDASAAARTFRSGMAEGKGRIRGKRSVGRPYRPILYGSGRVFGAQVMTRAIDELTDGSASANLTRYISRE